jgi:hypothetical protein
MDFIPDVNDEGRTSRESGDLKLDSDMGIQQSVVIGKGKTKLDLFRHYTSSLGTQHKLEIANGGKKKCSKKVALRRTLIELLCQSKELLRQSDVIRQKALRLQAQSEMLLEQDSKCTPDSNL